MNTTKAVPTLRSTATRFALVSLIPILLLGWLLHTAVRDTLRTRTADVYGDMTTAMFDMAGDALVQPGDLASGQPLPPERATIFDLLLERVGAETADVRVRMVTRDRHVVYANRAGDTDRLPPSPELQAALDGHRSTRYTTITTESGGRVDTLEIILPISFDGDPTVHGVIVASGIQPGIIETIDADVRTMQRTLTLGLAALWLGLLPIAVSITRRLKRESQHNEYLALHDTLTGLPNRNLLDDRLERAIEATARTGQSVGLLLMDLNRFKEVNDTLGHGKGDELLQRVADRLAANVRPLDTVCRLGGDEFAIVVTDIADGDALAGVADRVTDVLNAVFVIDGNVDDAVDLAVEVSIGGALYPQHAEDPEGLLRHADIAMYAAKARGESFMLYRADIDSHSPSRLTLAADLGRALEADDQILLHYQPVASPADGGIQAMEALVRWHHPRRGLLFPIDFVPMAEESGLIRRLTAKVLDVALAQERAWLDAGLDLAIAVNLSAADLRSTAVVDVVASALERHGVPAGHLELEITETGVLADPEKAVEVVAALRQLGVAIALDDFGTGYSSLTYLKRLRPDRLKIDRSFVDAMTREVTDAEIVRSLIELAHGLTIGVTAEGVETEEHWELLRSLSCDLVQGYYLARPLAPDLATGWLTARMPVVVSASP